MFSSRASKVENLFSKFAIELSNCKKNDAIKAIEDGLIKPLTTLLPSYEEFRTKFIDLEYTNTKEKNATDYYSVRYFINKMNLHCNENSNIVDQDCSIEHILPDDSENSITWNIGNLIPLESVINEKLGNKPYDQKKAEYLKSNYPEVKEFVTDHSIWESEQIMARAEELSRIFYQKIICRELRV